MTFLYNSGRLTALSRRALRVNAQHRDSRARPVSPDVALSRRQMLASVVLAELAVLAGVTLSYQYETTAGGTIVLVAVGLYIVAVLYGKVRSRAGTVSDTQPISEEQSAD